MPKNVGDLVKIIISTGIEKCNKSPNLVTLRTAYLGIYFPVN